jgi:GTPase SAR1 family protein
MGANTLKFLFCGLANAGKTSILRVLDNRAEEIPGLTPTLGVEYNAFKILGFDVATWDLGGQIKFRKKYISDYEKYFQAATAIFYVIDIQTVTDFKENLEYLNEILEVLKKLGSKDVFISLLLHKYDPHLRHDDQTIRKKIEPIAAKVEKAIVAFPHAFYQTTIYDPPTIYKAFSDTLLSRMSNVEVLNIRIEEIAKKVSSPAAILLAASGKLFGQWHSPEMQLADLAKFNQKVPIFAKLYSSDAFKNFSVFPMGENANIIVLSFLFREQLVLFCVVAEKGKVKVENAQELLRDEQSSLVKVLEVLNFK